MNVHEWVRRLEGLAPLRLAGAWDNVGLLLEGTRPIHRVGLCIDLTEPVLDELLAEGVDGILSYHPPLFRGLKRLTEASPRSRTLLRILREGVHVYSPHSALDAARGGMADWLLEPLGELADVQPITPDLLEPGLGAGRIGRKRKPETLDAMWPRIREHLGLVHLRVAGGKRRIETVAVCPGAGGSLFEGVEADLLLTGEMRHHDVLAQVEGGGAVVLTDHTNTERGYLNRYAEKVSEVCGVMVVRSSRDADPLRVVGG